MRLRRHFLRVDKLGCCVAMAWFGKKRKGGKNLSYNIGEFHYCEEIQERKRILFRECAKYLLIYESSVFLHGFITFPVLDFQFNNTQNTVKKILIGFGRHFSLEKVKVKAIILIEFIAILP